MSSPTARIGDNELYYTTCNSINCHPLLNGPLQLVLTDGDTCGMRQPTATVNLVLKMLHKHIHKECRI